MLIFLLTIWKQSHDHFWENALCQNVWFHQNESRCWSACLYVGRRCRTTFFLLRHPYWTLEKKQALPMTNFTRRIFKIRFWERISLGSQKASVLKSSLLQRTKLPFLYQGLIPAYTSTTCFASFVTKPVGKQEVWELLTEVNFRKKKRKHSERV